MAFASYGDLKKLELENVSIEILSTKKELFELRLKKATRQSFKPHLFKHHKRKVAQLLTIESERKQTIK
ncbi:MAG: 50S ribosomal protein L29 [Desulfuromonadaceae bacterium]